MFFYAKILLGIANNTFGKIKVYNQHPQDAIKKMTKCKQKGRKGDKVSNWGDG